MKVSHVKISNILGIKELEFDAQHFTEISGENGSGKTSVLEAIQSVLKTGHDATLLRTGETKGEAVLVLDDGTELSKTVTADKSTSKARVKGKLAGRPAEIIKSMSDLYSANPVEFIRARKQDRVKVLLESMPLTADADKLAAITGIPVSFEPGTHALAVINSVYKAVYDDRTGTNRAVEEKANTINQLRLTVPDPIDGVVGSEDELTEQISAADKLKNDELARIATKLQGIKDDNHKKTDEIRRLAQENIDKIKADAQASVEQLTTSFHGIEAKANTQREMTIQRHTDKVTPIKNALINIKNNRDATAKREQLLLTVAEMEKGLISLQTDAQRQNKALDDLNKYKADLLDSLPIPGVEIRDGEIYRDNIVFDRLNTAQQVWIAIEIAKLRNSNLPVCCVDGIELLDPKTYAEFKRQALESKLQLFVSRVSGEEFAVNTSQSE